MKRPIAEAAVSTSFFEQARFHPRTAETRLNDALLRQPGLSFQPIGITATVKNYALSDIVLDSVSGLLFQGQHEIQETSYFAPEGSILGPGAERNGLVRQQGDEDFIIGYNNAHGGYQHWLTQCLPAIDWSLRQQRTRGVRLVLPPLADWQEDLLDILGYGGVPRLTLQSGTLYHLPHVEYSDFLNGGAAFRVSLTVRDTARSILAGLPSRESASQILFVPHPEPYYGRVGNLGEVTDLLTRHGVTVVEPSLSTRERINLFRHADVVIGPLSDRLADVVFCKPGALVWEWMPQHHQNASINRLAQAADLDYWGDLFESNSVSQTSGQWIVDIATLTERLFELQRRPHVPHTDIHRQPTGISVQGGKPIDELMLSFESLGDNCEFGLVQRHAGVEPLGLLRFAGTRLGKLVEGLRSNLDGVGNIDNVVVYLAGEAGRREFMVHETSLDTRYHSFVLEGQIEGEELRAREAKRLGFLRRKLLEDLAVGEKIWVWREWGKTDPAPLRPLVEALRAFGPNTLLWVVSADAEHPAGTVEWLDRDFLKGYVERLAPYGNVAEFRAVSWFEVCENAYNQVSRSRQEVVPVTGVSAVPRPPLSAMEFLASNPAPSPLESRDRTIQRGGWWARLQRRFGRRVSRG